MVYMVGGGRHRVCRWCGAREEWPNPKSGAPMKNKHGDDEVGKDESKMGDGADFSTTFSRGVGLLRGQ